MPNWAYTNYLIEGPEEDLRKIEEAIKHHPVQEGSSENWEGNVIIALTGNMEYEPKKDRYMRGFIESETIECDGITLRFCAQEAWGATDFNEELEDTLPNIKVYYQTEESGGEVYATNDKERKHFVDKYYVDTCIDGEYDSEYFMDEDSIYMWLSMITKGKINSMEDVKKFNSDHEDSGDDDDNWINIHEFEIVD